MEYRSFGRTGLTVSCIGFGCGRTGGLLIDGSDAEKRLAVRKALDGGINWFDTAPSYGQGKSEEALGWLLEEVTESPLVSTKVSVDPGRGDLPGQIADSLARSLRRLRRDSVDLLQLHSRIDPGAGGRALDLDHVLGDGGAVEGLERVKKEGHCRFIGMTALGDTDAVIEGIASGRLDAAQVFYNFINPSAARPMPDAWTGQRLTGVISTCRATSTAVIGIRVLDAGLIAAEQRSERVSIMTKETNADTEERKVRAVFNSLGESYSVSRPETGIRFALSCPDVSLALVGMGAPEHVDGALSAVRKGPLPEDAFAVLEELYGTDFGVA